MRQRPALCSVALRHLDPAEVTACAVAGGAEAIEWEARRHVPPGDVDRARRAAGLSADAGLTVTSYGSYARASAPDAAEHFASCLIAADALGAPLIRVWGGDTRELAEIDRPTALAATAADLALFCDMAADHDISVSLEFHPGTFTETPASALELIARAGRPNLRSHWQPDYGQPIEEAVPSLRAMLAVLSHLHVFNWTRDHTRLPLDEAEPYWRRLFDLVEAGPPASHPRFAMLEFSRGDAVEHVTADLRALGRILGKSG